MCPSRNLRVALTDSAVPAADIDGLPAVKKIGEPAAGESPRHGPPSPTQPSLDEVRHSQ